MYKNKEFPSCLMKNICTSGHFLFGEVICADRCASSRCRLSSVIVEQVFIRLITIRCTLERAVQSLKKRSFGSELAKFT